MPPARSALGHMRSPIQNSPVRREVEPFFNLGSTARCCRAFRAGDPSVSTWSRPTSPRPFTSIAWTTTPPTFGWFVRAWRRRSVRTTRCLRRRITRSRWTTATSAHGRASAVRSGGRTTICRWWPASRGFSGASWRRATFRRWRHSPRCPCRSRSSPSAARPPLSSACASRRVCSSSPERRSNRSSR